MKYIKRIFDDILDYSLKTKGAVVVVGPKWCGKSTTASRHAASIIDLMSISSRQEYIELAKIAPEEFLRSENRPLLIDEWQHVSFLWDQIKYEVDKTGEFGQFILTGSVSERQKEDNLMDDNRHTGNGRIIRKMMRTMSLYESGESNGIVSIGDLKKGIFKSCRCDKTIYDYAYYICRGGWPLAVLQEKEIALQQAIDYYEVVVSDDIFSLKDISLRKDEQRARKVMRSYARNISIAATDETLRNDVSATDESFDKDVFSKYLNALRNLYVIEELPAWNPNLRSKTSIRTKETRHFVDPSIATAALGLSPDALFKNIIEYGLLFESLTIRDLRIYCDALRAKLYKYRDSKKREADAVIQFFDGSWALIEVKLGGQEDIDMAAENLKNIANDIDVKTTGEPSFLMVITKNQFAYQREDGVYVVPLACLKY